MSDLISRQAAYDTLTEYYHHRTNAQHDALQDALNRVPSAEPEIIRCKDCKYYTDVFDIGRIFEKGACEKLYLDTVRPDDFCSWAERRGENG